jgi:hypothetical protein
MLQRSGTITSGRCQCCGRVSDNIDLRTYQIDIPDPLRFCLPAHVDGRAVLPITNLRNRHAQLNLLLPHFNLACAIDSRHWDIHQWMWVGQIMVLSRMEKFIMDYGLLLLQSDCQVQTDAGRGRIVSALQRRIHREFTFQIQEWNSLHRRFYTNSED